VIIVQVNVLICDPYPIRGKPEGSAKENVSRNRQNIDLKNEILILGKIYRQKQSTSRINVNRLLKRLSSEIKEGNSRIFRWIVNKMRKWKNKSQISLIYSSHNVKIVNLISSLCHNCYHKRHKSNFEMEYYLIITLIIVARINKVDKYLLRNITIRLIIWLTIMISTSEMLSLTIYLDLLRQNVESNPGMAKSNNILTVISYNANGLEDKTKLRRLLAKVEPIVSKGGIILLQETHLKETNYLKLIWKFNYVSNCTKTNSAGVIILFNKEYESLDCFSDNNGRHLMVALESGETKLIISNSYLPNDHREGIIFAEEMYLMILEFQHKYPEHLTIAGGDMNVCMDKQDSINRNSTIAERCLSDTFKNNNKITNIVDTYRAMHKVGGYTWNRGNCYSRLDYIFASNQLIQRICSAKHDWAFEASDHAAVQIDFRLDNKPERGPGTVKVNTRILEDPKIREQIRSEIKDMMTQTDNSWNPQPKLEFLKMTIRTVFSTKISDIRKNINRDILELEDEINQMEEFKVNILEHNSNGNVDSTNKISKIDIAILNLNEKLAQQRNKLCESKTFVSRSKWFEYGEKSNKFFLGLMKSRQNQKLISEIRNDSKIYTGQKEISKGITDFYRKLYEKDLKVKNIDNDEDFYKHCPKLSPTQAGTVDSELTNSDLLKALKTCKDSSPGPDGIPYIIYKTFWNITGPIMLEAWKYSVEIQKLPPSHHESTITLLPKEGKDLRDIKNWRPITLSNCDSKIITKALSMKVAKVLDSIIDPSQTAYVPGRSVADNLRANFYMKNHCKKLNLDSVLISLDAKKAFDSVDHKYIENTLKAYGFGGGFISIFKMLYRDITARILINGFQSESIRIERGVKQGDALSCAIFIICIDPLLRNINESKNIKEIRINKSSIVFKAGAFADDVSVVCQNKLKVIQGVFDEYSRLTERSGLELNAEKTEILRLNNNQESSIKLNYNGGTFTINTIKELKICGLYFCNNKEDEYKLNVSDKIDKLSYKIKQWTPRHLTMEGKALIIKTFGLSQLVYNMQSYKFHLIDLKNAEKLIFKFIWSTNDKQNGVDRISRKVMKNEFEEGGMRITDVECLDRTLKLRQFIRASNSNHVIAKIQSLVVGTNDEIVIKQEYHKVTKEEDICESAQETLNIMTDYSREQYCSMEEHEYESDKNLIEEVAAINLETYLKRKNRMFVLCILKPLTSLGITYLGELVQAYEHEIDNNTNKAMNIVISNIPKALINIVKCYKGDANLINTRHNYLRLTKEKRLAIEVVSTRELQSSLKIALGRVESMNFNTKLAIDEFNTSNITTVRSHCKNAKLRNIYFRLIHNDFFTHSRMKRYNMTPSDKCLRCNSIETSEHLLWECNHAKNIWNLYNELMTKLGRMDSIIKEYKQIFNAGEIMGITIIKIKIIQEMIQIKRPTNWNMGKLETVVKQIVDMERHNFKIKHNLHQFNTKWNFLK
jgi:exonuclease III